MLKFYLSTIIIWYIIIYATCKLTSPIIKKNGWDKLYANTNENKSKIKGLFGCLLISAIPIFRLVVVIGLFILAFNKIKGED